MTKPMPNINVEERMMCCSEKNPPSVTYCLPDADVEESGGRRRESSSWLPDFLITVVRGARDPDIMVHGYGGGRV